MSDFTFLTKEQCFGKEKLDIFEKRGTQAAITDFSILLGGWVSNYRISNDNSLEGRTGIYWTKSYGGYYYMDVVREDGSEYAYYIDKRQCGVRPALPFSEEGSIPTNGESGKRAKDGILEVEYGYYPQKAVAKDMQERLEREYKSDKLSKTRNSYTTDSVSYDGYNPIFQPQIHQEYEYNGKKFVRVQVKLNIYQENKLTLSNGEQYKDEDHVWVEVSPVKWIVDEKSHMMITEKLIFAGVQFKYDFKEIYNP